MQQASTDNETIPTPARVPHPRRWRRRAIRLALGSLAILAAALLLLLLGLDRLVRRQIEQQTTRSLNLPTSVKSSVFSVLGHGLDVHDFRIASPPGFSTEPMLVLDNTHLGVTLSALRDDPVYLSNVVFIKPRLMIENVNGSLNFKRMIDDLPPASPHPLKLVIDEVTIQDATVILRPGLPGMAREIVVPVQTFTLHNFGKRNGHSDGALLKDVLIKLVTELASRASDSDALPPDLRLLMKGDVGAILRTAIPGDLGKVFGGLLGSTRPTTRRSP